jgi:hypothetical protein
MKDDHLQIWQSFGQAEYSGCLATFVVELHSDTTQE